MDDTTDDPPSTKVARLIAEYDLDGIGADLETRWTGSGTDRMSLRDLADYFNRQLLDARLREAGQERLLQDVETIYRTLTDETVSAGQATEARTRLAEAGVDVDTLERDFVTYQAIRSYLTAVRGAEYEGPSDAEKRRKDLETIQRLVTRTQSVATERLETLRDTGRIDAGEFEVLFDLQVLCQECGAQYTVAEFLEREGCHCRQS